MIRDPSSLCLVALIVALILAWSVAPWIDALGATKPVPECPREQPAAKPRRIEA